MFLLQCLFFSVKSHVDRLTISVLSLVLVFKAVRYVSDLSCYPVFGLLVIFLHFFTLSLAVFLLFPSCPILSQYCTLFLFFGSCR